VDVRRNDVARQVAADELPFDGTGCHVDNMRDEVAA
jgi:hypothetical protein